MFFFLRQVSFEVMENGFLTSLGTGHPPCFFVFPPPLVSGFIFFHYPFSNYFPQETQIPSDGFVASLFSMAPV